MSLSDAPPSKPPAPRSRRGRDRLILPALLALLLVGLVGLAAATGWRETWAQVSGLGLAQLAALLALSVLNYALRGLRWHIFARRLGLRTGPVANLRHFIGGFAMSVTPGRVGELVRMRWIARETGWQPERAAPLVLLDRAADLAAMAVLLALAVALAARGIAGAVPVAALALAAALVVTRPRLLAAALTLAYRLSGRFARGFARGRSAARSLGRFSHGPTLAAALALGLVGWGAEGYAFYLLLGWMGADLGLWKALAIFVFATLAGGLTGAPGGLGGAEAAMVALLALDGVPMETALAATAIIRVTTLWFAILLGLAVFPLAERISTRAAHDLENR
jgi:uncharacterized protein (TIRG00374 family)